MDSQSIKGQLEYPGKCSVNNPENTQTNKLAIKNSTKNTTTIKDHIQSDTKKITNKLKHFPHEHIADITNRPSPKELHRRRPFQS